MSCIRTLLVLLLLLPVSVSAGGGAGDIHTVVVVGPSWENFTNKDGTGLYHDILNAVFGLYGITMVRQYVPSERAYDLVRSGRADIMTCHDEAEAPLQLARHPMYAGAYHVFFSPEREGPWRGVQTMRDKTVVWRIGYYSQHNFPVSVHPREVKSGSAALGMVLLGRADFYVDDALFIKTSIEENKIPFDPEMFETRIAGYRTYHPVLLQSDRGNAIKDLYDRGIEQLIMEGRLQSIFAKWGFPFPPYVFNGTSQ